MLHKRGTQLGRPRSLAHVLDELDRTPQHQKLSFTFTFDLQRVETMAVGGYRQIPAELEEDRAEAPASLIRARGDENGFEGAEARSSNRLLVTSRPSTSGNSRGSWPEKIAPSIDTL
jgi:hypothetical protein